MGTRAWLVALTGLAAIRVAVPLAALVGSGGALPGLPRYDYVGFTGDASGFYAATREFLASWGRLPVPVLLGLVAASLAAAALIAWAWSRRRAPRPWLVVASAAVFALVVSAAVSGMHPPGAAVFGWPLVWSLPMLPYRALGGPLDPDVAFGFGLVLSLAANAVTVVATAYAGFYATGRRGLGLGAAAAFALWPLLVGFIGGERAWGNGTWSVDAGLAMYSEPLSTALCAGALALVLSPRPTDLRLALGGVALGLGTAVKLSNVLLAAALVPLLLVRLDLRRALPFVAGALAFAPLVLAYWPKGYAAQFDNPRSWPRHPFSADYVTRSWADSLLFSPRTLLVLAPVALLGALVLRGWWPRGVLGAWVLVTAVFYSFYAVTPQHPRFLFVALPAVFVLWAVGAAAIIRGSAGVPALAQRRLEPGDAGRSRARRRA